MKKTIAAVVAGISLLWASSAFADATSDLNKVVVAKSQSGLALATDPSVSVQINNKSRKKRMIEVNGIVSTGSSVGTLTAEVYINGVALEPGTAYQKCNGGCTLSATWFLDVDQAELANPGVLYYDKTTNNTLLLVELQGSSTTATTGTVSLTAKLLKK